MAAPAGRADLPRSLLLRGGRDLRRSSSAREVRRLLRCRDGRASARRLPPQHRCDRLHQQRGDDAQPARRPRHAHIRVKLPEHRDERAEAWPERHRRLGSVRPRSGLPEAVTHHPVRLRASERHRRGPGVCGRARPRSGGVRRRRVRREVRGGRPLPLRLRRLETPSPVPWHGEGGGCAGGLPRPAGDHQRAAGRAPQEQQVHR